MTMEQHKLLERYEVRGEEADFLAAQVLFEQSLAADPNAALLRDYGYLLECHARNELRRAVDQYRRAMVLDPDAEQVRYQLIGALGALGDTDEMVALYRERLAAAPGELREYRFLARAYLAAGAREEARLVIQAGLDLVVDDATLIALAGEVKAASGDVEGALADWRRALELDPATIGPLYSIAFLLEGEGRLEDAAEIWRSITDWETDGDEVAAEFPKRELARVRGKIARR